MKILKSFKFRLKTNSQIEGQLDTYSGCTRFVWNKFLALNLERLSKKHKMLWFYEMSFWLTIWKSSEEYGFLNGCPAQVLQQKLKDLDKAFKDGFDKKQPLKRLPDWKKKELDNSFRFPSGTKLNGNSIFLPKLGWVKFFKSRDITGEVKNVTVSKSAEHWYIAIQTEQEVENPVHHSVSSIGIDLGVAKFATLSDGTIYQPVNSFKNSQKKLAKAQKKLRRKKRFSGNWKKQVRRVRKVHTKVANTRKDYLHKVSTEICKNHATIFVEDLKIANMSKSAKGDIDNPGKNVSAKSGLNRSILDQGWGEFLRQLTYKSQWRGGKVIAVPPKYTSQTCHHCGSVDRRNRPSQEHFSCVDCGYKANADVNAALNIRAVGLTVLACGESTLVPSVKQELLRKSDQLAA